jgi:hypothetical protein
MNILIEDAEKLEYLTSFGQKIPTRNAAFVAAKKESATLRRIVAGCGRIHKNFTFAATRKNSRQPEMSLSSSIVLMMRRIGFGRR